MQRKHVRSHGTNIPEMPHLRVPDRQRAIKDRKKCNAAQNLHRTRHVDHGPPPWHFGHLTNAFSRKAAKHVRAVALRILHDNFCRTHKTPRIPPAMASDVTDRLLNVQDIDARIEKVEAEAEPKTRASCKPRKKTIRSDPRPCRADAAWRRGFQRQPRLGWRESRPRSAGMPLPQPTICALSVSSVFRACCARQGRRLRCW